MALVVEIAMELFHEKEKRKGKKEVEDNMQGQPTMPECERDEMLASCQTPDARPSKSIVERFIQKRHSSLKIKSNPSIDTFI